MFTKVLSDAFYTISLIAFIWMMVVPEYFYGFMTVIVIATMTGYRFENKHRKEQFKNKTYDTDRNQA